jgi:hypothetical protein
MIFMKTSAQIAALVPFQGFLPAPRRNRGRDERRPANRVAGSTSGGMTSNRPNGT